MAKATKKKADPADDALDATPAPAAVGGEQPDANASDDPGTPAADAAPAAPGADPDDDAAGAGAEDDPTDPAAAGEAAAGAPPVVDGLIHGEPLNISDELRASLPPLGGPADGPPEFFEGAPASAEPVALLPVKFQQHRAVLAHPYHLAAPADELIIKGRAYAFAGTTWNPHKLRAEHELAEITLASEAEIQALIAAGWVQE